MSKLTAAVTAILACMVLVPLLPRAQRRKPTWVFRVSVSTTSLSGTPRITGFTRNTTSMSILLRLVVAPFWRKPCYRAVFTLPPLGPPFCKSSMQGADHVILAAHVNYFPYRLVGLPSIAGPEGLKRRDDRDQPFRFKRGRRIEDSAKAGRPRSGQRCDDCSVGNSTRTPCCS